MVYVIAKHQAVVSNCIYSVIKLVLHRKNLHKFNFNTMKARHNIVDGSTDTKLKAHMNAKAALKYIQQKPSNCGTHNLVSET